MAVGLKLSLKGSVSETVTLCALGVGEEVQVSGLVRLNVEVGVPVLVLVAGEAVTETVSL